MLQKEAPAIKPARAQKVKVHKPGLRAPEAGSAPSAARAVDSRCMRKFCILSLRRFCSLDSFGIEVVSWHCQFPRKTGVKKPGS